jgi:hypothetical protein
MKVRFLCIYLSCFFVFVISAFLRAQSLGNAGTIEGTVVDPSGAVVVGADVTLHSPVTGYSQSAKSASDGSFKLVNIPPNPYHLEGKASGFNDFSQDVTVRSSVPIQVKVALTVAGASTTVNVEAGMVEIDPSAHVDVDRNQFTKLPQSDPGTSLSQAIAYSTGGVAADANGFFHPLGDHAQVSFMVDGQPISDQQTKIFSTQIPMSAVQSMEVITGTPNSEFGDKTSLVAQITTRSGLGAKRVFGNVEAIYGSYGNAGGSVGLGYGNEKVGNFLSLDGLRTERFLDTPELTPFHGTGNNASFFDRLDLQPTGKDAFHLNLFAARNWFQIPNSFDQLGQDQRQRVLTWNVAPGYQHTFSSHALLTINPYIRHDQLAYFPSSDSFADSPATQSQRRHLLDWGVRSDVALTHGRHNIKVGADLKQTRLLENFNFGVTDPAFNPVCLTRVGDPVTIPTLTNPALCASRGFARNPDFSPGLLPFDLSRGGRLFAFHDTANINRYGFYVQDAIKAGNFLFNLGLRGDVYHGVVSDGAAQPRAGVAYNIKKSGTVLRAAYARTFETPFNENLLLSSATGVGGLATQVFGASSAVPVSPGRRNQYNAGFQQALGRYLLLDADYFWKFTDNAYDFSILLNTTITFPIAWHKSKLDGVTGRLSTINMRGFQAYWTFGHNRARYFPPETGGLISVQPEGVFRIDHDQEFQSTLLLRYQRPRNAEWVSWSWRYDSGLVVSGVRDVDAVLGLTAAQQTTLGFACDGVAATIDKPITTCNGAGTSKLIALPQTGKEQDDHNPDRVKPRNVFNLGIGTDNLLHAEGPKRIKASVEITNLTNVVALYNFLSTFSGTHFLAPRIVIGRIGFVF